MVAGAQVARHHIDEAGLVRRLGLGRYRPEPFKPSGIGTPRPAFRINGASPSVGSGLDGGALEAIAYPNDCGTLPDIGGGRGHRLCDELGISLWNFRREFG